MGHFYYHDIKVFCWRIVYVEQRKLARLLLSNTLLLLLLLLLHRTLYLHDLPKMC